MKEFIKMRDRLIENFNEMSKDIDKLFEVEVDKDVMWDLYQDSFPPGTNKIYRERREHDCSECRQFMRNFGNVVVIKDNKVKTIWDFNTDSDTYQPVMDALDKFIKSHVVSNIYVSKLNRIGIKENRELTDDGKVIEWSHMYINLPDKFVDRTNRSEGDIKGGFRDVRNVFKRSLDEISEESVMTVLELIKENNLYRGQEWAHALNEFLRYKREYILLNSEEEIHNYAWEKSIVAGSVVGKIRNHSMGVLLTNISEGMSLETAINKYESIVAGANYKRSTPVFTQKMKDDAIKDLKEMGFIDSLERRFATADDISINNILYCNRDTAKRVMGGSSILDLLDEDVSVKPRKFDRVDEIGIEEFINDILPEAKSVEAYVENKHANNLVSLIAPGVDGSKSMFKWDNGFSWAYAGNMTDSMKERVKAAGGKVDGDLRFSIQWNESGKDNSDVDAHCITPRYHIYFADKIDPITKGNLDVDIRYPNGKIAVENITWPDRKLMKDGVYKFYVNQFSARGSKGFSAEIEFDGQIYSFEYDKPMRTGQDVQVAEVTLKNGVFTIKEKLPSTTTSKDAWGVKTNTFVPVSVVCLSPNYWQNEIGLKHYFFMLKGCVNPEEPNGLFNEFLVEDLMKHRKVMEALGAKAHVYTVEDQLSGLGFASSKRNELVVKVKTDTEKVMKIKF